MPTLVARVRQGKVIRTINKKTTEEKIIQLRKALGLNLREEAKRFAIKVDMGWIGQQFSTN
jgi:hypothetical protein